VVDIAGSILIVLVLYFFSKHFLFSAKK